MTVFGNPILKILGLKMMSHKFLWLTITMILALSRKLDAQFSTGDSTCFTVNNSDQCPFLNGLKVHPVADLYTNEQELEIFLAGQDSRSSDYMQTFASENDCDISTTNTHRYHKSVSCYTILAGSRSCRNSVEPRLCRDQCEQYILSARATLTNSSLCTQNPSRSAQSNRAMIMSPMSSLKSLCSQLPMAPENSPGVLPANVGVCNRGTDDEFVKCGLDDDDDIQDYCKKASGKYDSCCTIAVNEVAKRVIPKTVNPATDKYWIITALAIAAALLLGFIAWSVSVLTNWKNRATVASKPLFRKSMSAATGYEPTYTEKKLALDKINDERFTRGGKGTDTAFFGGNRKSMLVDAMKGDGFNQEATEGIEQFEVTGAEEQYEEEDEVPKPNILQNYEDQDFAIS